METRIIDILKGQPPLSDLLALVSGGDEVRIVEGEKPLARIVPAPTAPSEKQRIPGLNSGHGAVWTSDDFDEPLPDEFWVGTP